MTYDAELSDKQTQAIGYLSHESECITLLYGGAAGGGKSWLGCYWQIVRRLKYPGTRGMIARSELKDLKLTTMKRFWELSREMGLQPGVHYKYNEQLSIITWYNRSETILADIEHKPSDDDYNYLGSYELTDAFVDEAVGVPGRGIEILRSRIRYNLVNSRPKLLLASNPGKGYLYNEFYKPSLEGRMGVDKAFIPALLSDNTQYHDREVYRRVLMTLSERDKKRLLEGNWDYDDAPDLLFDRSEMIQMFVDDVEIKGEPCITCDPAAMGKDRTVIAIWKGLHLIKLLEFKHKYPHEVAAVLRTLATENQCPLNRVVVDSDGLGIGVVGPLKCVEFKNGSSAVDKEHFANLKGECYFKLSSMIKMNQIYLHDHSQRESIMKELDLVRDRTKEDKKKAVSPKEEIKALLGYSPDYADAIMMRMYFELNPNRGKYSYA